jgi:hypothetical protein
MNTDEIIETIESMRLLEEDWDSYGGTPPAIETITRAITFVHEFLGSGQPHVCPTNDGKISFEGDNGTSIEIGPCHERDEIWNSLE